MNKIVIADDHQLVSSAIRGMVENFPNCEVLYEVPNGQELLNRFENKRNIPDLVLLDINMPVMDGLSFLKQLRAQPNGKDPVVVFCTAERSIEKITEALDAGADEYVMKPFDSDIIASKFFQAGLLSA